MGRSSGWIPTEQTHAIGALIAAEGVEIRDASATIVVRDVVALQLRPRAKRECEGGRPRQARHRGRGRSPIRSSRAALAGGGARRAGKGGRKRGEGA